MKVESPNEVQKVQAFDQAEPLDNAVAKPSVAPAADDLSNLFSQEVALNSLALSQRSIKAQVIPAEQYVQLYELLGYPAQMSLPKLSQAIRRELRQRPSLSRLIGETGGDPARTFVLLKYMQATEKAKNPEDGALLDGALVELNAEYADKIRAGLNIADVMKTASSDPHERQVLRTQYYDHVVSNPSVANLIKALLDMYGTDGLARGLSVYSQALANDIAAPESSTAKGKLHGLLFGLKSCSHLSSVLRACDELITWLNAPLDAVTLLKTLLGYANTGITPAQIILLGKELSSEDRSAQLVALNALMPLIKSLPLAWWSDKRTRDESLAKIKVVLDQMTRAELGPQWHPGGSRTGV